MASLKIEWDDCQDNDKQGVALWTDLSEQKIDEVLTIVVNKFGLPGSLK